MSTVYRICPACGQDGPVEARHCPHCGNDTEAPAMPIVRDSLPMVLGKAALPLLAGAASLALRAGWKLLQSRMAQAAAEKAVNAVLQPNPTSATPVSTASPQTAKRGQRTIRIRSSWAVGDANGVWRQGVSEQTIEIDE